MTTVDDEITRYVRHAVAAAPPLAPDQFDSLRAIVRPAAIPFSELIRRHRDRDHCTGCDACR